MYGLAIAQSTYGGKRDLDPDGDVPVRVSRVAILEYPIKSIIWGSRNKNPVRVIKASPVSRRIVAKLDRRSFSIYQPQRIFTLKLKKENGEN